MAEKTLKTRIALLYKTYEQWTELATYVPLKGEVCICEVPSQTSAVVNEPALLFKVGDGATTFQELTWASALAADVFAWAKKANLEFTDLSDAFLNKLDERIAEKSENVEYQLVNVEGIFKLQKREIGATDWTDVSTIDVKALLDEKQDLITETNQLGSNLVSFDKGQTSMTSTTVEGALREAWNAIGQGGTASTVNVVKKAEAEEGYAATYVVTQGGEQVGVSINIPKDFLVKKAELKECTEDDKPVAGLLVGDKYIDFTINTKDDQGQASHVYLPVKDLVDVYKGDEQTITLGAGNVFSVKAVPMDKITGLAAALDLKATKAELEAEAVAREAADEELAIRVEELEKHHLPELIETADGKHALFANGVAIRIEDAGTENICYYETTHLGEKSFKFPYATRVYGGGNGTAAKAANFDSSMIVMNSGKLINMYGGSNHYGSVGVVTIILNGGTLTEGIQAGGANGVNGDTTTVGIANVTLNGGTELVAYGGGMGSATVGMTNMTINGGTHQLVTCGGSNGVTGKARLVVNGGNITCLQTVNRGLVHEAEVEINGGTITNMYAGGETDDSSVTGKCEKAILNIFKSFGGALHKGTYGGVEDATRCSGNYATGAITEAEALACNLVEELLILNCNL